MWRGSRCPDVKRRGEGLSSISTGREDTALFQFMRRVAAHSA
ncbi:hypothetical protein BSLA_01f3025 [Burkholderia stabilis]|nr:hypothetical protein BSLA_01f3025 [Burkholderia stabilis]